MFFELSQPSNESFVVPSLTPFYWHGMFLKSGSDLSVATDV